jgi:hypothetical protein
VKDFDLHVGCLPGSTALKVEVTHWEDLRFPSAGINPPGAAADPTRSTTTGMLEFAGNADNILAGTAQMPHAWKEGSTISPHIHLWFPTSASANTRWKFEYDFATINGDFVNTYGTYTDGGTITVANPQSVKKHVLAGFTDIALTGCKISTQLVWKLSRLASSDAADNDTSVCVLLEFDIHYECDSAGSEQEFVK